MDSQAMEIEAVHVREVGGSLGSWPRTSDPLPSSRCPLLLCQQLERAELQVPSRRLRESVARFVIWSSSSGRFFCQRCLPANCIAVVVVLLVSPTLIWCVYCLPTSYILLLLPACDYRTQTSFEYLLKAQQRVSVVGQEEPTTTTSRAGSAPRAAQHYECSPCDCGAWLSVTTSHAAMIVARLR